MLCLFLLIILKKRWSKSCASHFSLHSPAKSSSTFKGPATIWWATPSKSQQLTKMIRDSKEEKSNLRVILLVSRPHAPQTRLHTKSLMSSRAKFISRKAGPLLLQTVELFRPTISSSNSSNRSHNSPTRDQNWS